MNAGELRLSELLRLPVVDTTGEEMAIIDVRTSQPDLPRAPQIVGLLCSPARPIGSLGVKRHDTAHSLGRRRTRGRGRFVPWHQIAAIDAGAVRLVGRFSELPALADAREPGPPALPDSTRP
jgi:hypothetical protein